jgi:hypothetical protein
MSNNNVYPIQLLNDLHNWYPDILYNPARFNTVQDLLDYVRSGADVNPYTRGLALYNSWRHAGTTRAPTAVSAASTHIFPSSVSSNVVNPYNSPSIPTVTIPATSGSVTVTPIQPQPITATATTAAGGAGVRYTPPQTSVVSIFEYLMDNGDELIPTTNIRASIPLTFSDTANNRIGTSILSALLGLQSSGSGGLESFLNQTVTVRPTQEQIAVNTTLSTSDSVQEDNCAICQDSVDAGQEMRRINHCGHFFHKDCIDTWLGTNVHCPTCRHDIRESSPTSADSVTGVNEIETDSDVDDTKTDM